MKMNSQVKKNRRTQRLAASRQHKAELVVEQRKLSLRLFCLAKLLLPTGSSLHCTHLIGYESLMFVWNLPLFHCAFAPQHRSLLFLRLQCFGTMK